MKIMFYQVEKINLKLLPFYIAFILIIMIYIVIPIIKYLIAKIKGVDFYINKSNHLPFVPRKYIPYNINEILKVIPDFNELKFQQKTFEIYKQVQTSLNDFNIQNLRNYATDELYNLYKKQLEVLKRKHIKKITKDFKLIYFNIVGMEIKKETVSLTVFMKIECFDYKINKTGKIIRGSKRKKVVHNYRMTFMKGIGKQNKCPNCGATLKNTNSTTCEYCNSVIIGEKYDWILSEKLITSSHMKRKKFKYFIEK